MGYIVIFLRLKIEKTGPIQYTYIVEEKTLWDREFSEFKLE